MPKKIQGEGDYEAARRFNLRSSKLARHKLDKPPQPTHPTTTQEVAAEREGRKRSKAGMQDSRDARLMEQLVKKQPG